MLLLSMYVLYSNVTYIYPVSCLVKIKLFQIVSNCFMQRIGWVLASADNKTVHEWIIEKVMDAYHHRKLDCCGVFQRFYCSTLNMLMANYRKRKKCYISTGFVWSNSRGGPWFSSIFYLIYVCRTPWTPDNYYNGAVSSTGARKLEPLQ